MLSSRSVHSVLSERPCVLCGERQAVRLGPRDMRVSALTVCARCGHVRSEPDPPRRSRQLISLRAEPAARRLVRWGRAAARVLRALGAQAPGSLLVDANDRGVLAYISKHQGLAVAALGDPLATPYAREQFSVTISSTLEPGVMFDAAIVHDVLQFEVDPVARLREFAAHLAPGAALLVDVPALDDPLFAAAASLRGGARHHFSARALAHALSLAGFEVGPIAALEGGRRLRALAHRLAPAQVEAATENAAPEAIDPRAAHPLYPLDVIEHLRRATPLRLALGLRWVGAALVQLREATVAVLLAAAGGSARTLALRGAHCA